MPDKIYLQLEGQDMWGSEMNNQVDECSWCQDRINASDVEYIRFDKSRELAEADIEAMLLKLMPQNMPLYLDSDLWQLRSDDMEEVILQQEVNESALAFFYRCKEYHLINSPE